MNRRIFIFWMVAIIATTSCGSFKGRKNEVREDGWQDCLRKELPLLGHRNWILIVDKAFPMQNSQGITTLSTGEKLLPVLIKVKSMLKESPHITPLYYRDRELEFLLAERVPGIGAYRDSLGKILSGEPEMTLCHDSVFTMIDEASRLFRVIVLKTDELIPYSSVFIFLDCKYWSPEKEDELRIIMKKQAMDEGARPGESGSSAIAQ